MLKSAKLAICKVPANDMEAFKSSLMGLFAKKRCMNFYKYVENVDYNDKKTWKDINIEVQPMKDVYKKYGLEANTIDFLGHAVALHVDDKYLDRPAKDTIDKINFYLDSIGRYVDCPFFTQFMVLEVFLKHSQDSAQFMEEHTCLTPKWTRFF